MKKQFMVPNLDIVSDITFDEAVRRLEANLAHFRTDSSSKDIEYNITHFPCVIQGLCGLMGAENNNVFIGKAKRHRIEFRQYAHGDTVFRYSHKTDITIGTGFLEEEVHYRVASPESVQIIVRNWPDNYISLMVFDNEVTVFTTLGELA